MGTAPGTAGGGVGGIPGSRLRRVVQTGLGILEKAAASELSLWDRRLPAHLRLGAEFGLRREEQSSLQKLQRQAEAAAAAAAAVRDAHLGGLRKSASVPALLTSMRHRRPPQLKPLVRAARY